ncbi:MAG: trans-L-3-hydroxyproline dehydratase [Sneathiella sp.]
MAPTFCFFIVILSGIGKYDASVKNFATLFHSKSKEHLMNPIKTVEMHTGGEPLRIITEGVPLPNGLTLAEKRRYLRDEADHYRRFLMFEPRGHRDMYGALLVPADTDDADFGVIFMHNEGYGTMCGHAIIALGRYAVDHGIVEPINGVAHVTLQCPSGLIKATVDIHDGRSTAVRFESAPSFAFKIDQFVNTAPYGPVELDIGFGGAFYGILDAASIGLNLSSTPAQDFILAANILKQAINKEVEITHPVEPDIDYLYGIIFTDGQTGAGPKPSKNICVFADGQLDRSPTGSGNAARLAILAAKGGLDENQDYHFESITGSVFKATVKSHATIDRYKGVTVEVSGRAHYSGIAEFTAEDDDMLGSGFLLR